MINLTQRFYAGAEFVNGNMLLIAMQILCRMLHSGTISTDTVNHSQVFTRSISYLLNEEKKPTLTRTELSIQL